MAIKRTWIRGMRDAAIFVVGMGGLTISVGGGAACLFGLSEAAILRLAEVVRPHQRAIPALFWYGAAGAGAGFTLFGVNVALARSCGEHDLEEEEAQKPQATPPVPNPLAGCGGCRNFHGQAHGGVLLVCAVHPYGWDGNGGCPDWRERA